MLILNPASALKNTSIQRVTQDGIGTTPAEKTCFKISDHEKDDYAGCIFRRALGAVDPNSTINYFIV